MFVIFQRKFTYKQIQAREYLLNNSNIKASYKQDDERIYVGQDTVQRSTKKKQDVYLGYVEREN